MERTALAGDPGTLCGERAVHQFRESAADREAETRPAIPPRDRGVGLAERLEEAVHPVGRDPDAGVADHDRELPEVARFAFARQRPAGDAELDLACLGEL